MGITARVNPDGTTSIEYPRFTKPITTVATSLVHAPSSTSHIVTIDTEDDDKAHLFLNGDLDELDSYIDCTKLNGSSVFKVNHHGTVTALKYMTTIIEY